MRSAPIILAVALSSSAACAYAAPLLYQGELSDGGRPANGYYDLQLTPYRDAKSSTQLAAPVTLAGVKVENGHFQVEAEFDSRLIPEQEAYLELAVRDGGSGAKFEALPGRQKATTATATIGACWSSTGDAGVNPASNFLGTTDNEPLILKAKGLRSALFTPSSDNLNPDSPNVVLGASTNGVAAGMLGATIAGGGDGLSNCGPFANKSCANTVTDGWGTVGGGRANTAASEAVVGGGSNNQASAGFAVVSGGVNNLAGGSASAIAGGQGNSASGSGASVLGGQYNSASGVAATVAGGDNNSASARGAFAAGQFANAVYAGAFAWGDDSSTAVNPHPTITATGPNQFLVRAVGGFALNTTPISPNAEMTIMGSDGNVDVNLFPKNATYGYAVVATGSSQSDTHFFITQTNGTSVFTPRMEIAPTGLVGFGRTPATNTLEVEGTASKTTSGSWLANSDARIKQEIEPIAHPLDALLALKPVTFRYTDAYRAAHPSIVDKRYYNVVAQQFAEVFPDAVQSSREYLPGSAPSSENEILQVDIHPALITTIAAAQELARDNAELRARLAALEQRVATLAQTQADAR